MLRKTLALVGGLLIGALNLSAAAPDPSSAGLEQNFTKTIQPFIKAYCIDCHSGETPEAQFNLGAYTSMSSVIQDQGHWPALMEKLTTKKMPPKDADAFPSPEARQEVIDWVKAIRNDEIHKHAGDPGIVLARRLSNAELNYTIRDLTGQDLKPAKEFPVDPANLAGFDNSGESLSMSPELMNKYLQAAREVANHVVLKLDGIAFAPHPMLVETDRDKYCVNQIIDFYHAQNTNYADDFFAAWKYKNRVALGKPQASLEEIAAQENVSRKYLDTVWRFLDETKEEVGPGAKLQTMWRELPPSDAEAARAGCDQMRTFVVAFRAKVEPRFPNLAAGSIRANSQPFLMWKNKQYATHRMTFDQRALQVEGETTVAQAEASVADPEPGADNEFGPGKTKPVMNKPGDPDLVVPKGERPRYEEAFGRFCAVFPDNFYVEERGRNYLDKSKDRGRYLSAGFHNVMGYFRDDQPLYELILDAKQQKELDTCWRELDFIAHGQIRTYIQFFFNESGEARGTSRESEGPRPKDIDVISEKMVMQLKETYLSRVRSSKNETAIKALEDHFNWINDGIRWVEKANVETQPKHLDALLVFAARAYRRPLVTKERDDLLAYYRSLRDEVGLTHEDAMRDCIVLVLMSPDFCYRIDLGSTPNGQASAVQPLSDYALASRLGYFLWSSMPDVELLAHAAAGDLHKPEVITAQAKRMLKDPRTRALATEFGGNWLDFRRFEELNTVDRERFTTFTNELRDAMFEEPVRFTLDVFNNDRPVLDFVYANHTFVNPVLAMHYGMPGPTGELTKWVRINDADKYGRGGLLPMAAFLTQNAPGLRTSPVKRGYWVVKRVLGEQIPPPPAVVPELPRDESTMDLPLRQKLEQHRADPICAACHQRFDSLGLVFEGYGPIGERRERDLAGHPIDAHASFPDGSEGTGFNGVKKYIREHRQDDFIDNLCRKMLAYGLGRTLQLSDELTIEQMRAKLAKNDYRFDTIVTEIVTSPQFLNKRGPEATVQR